MIFTLDSLAGINNVDDALRRCKVQFTPDGNAQLSGDLKSAVNFRITKDGIGTLRNGMTQKASGTNLKYLWCNKAGNIGLFVDGTSLKILNSDYTSTTLGTVTANRRMTCEEHNGAIYMGNGAEMVKYKDSTYSTWGDAATVAAEFETPQLVYIPPPPSDILLSYRARMYVASGRFALYSDSMYAERFRKAWYLTIDEDITAMSSDDGGIYLHGLNTTTYFAGLDPEDMTRGETRPIGAVRHGVIKPLATPYILSRTGWAACQSGQIQFVDDENFRLDLPATAEAYLGYDPIYHEIQARILT